MAEIESHALTEIYYSLFDHDDSSSDSQGANTTCDKMTACSTCVEFYSIKEKSSCIWCTTPKEGAPDVNCLPRSKAQDNCAIEELRVSVLAEGFYLNESAQLYLPRMSHDQEHLQDKIYY